MRTLQERTCARDRVLCLRHIQTSEHQHRPVGDGAEVQRAELSSVATFETT
jgi:hypothetical protein